MTKNSCDTCKHILEDCTDAKIHTTKISDVIVTKCDTWEPKEFKCQNATWRLKMNSCKYPITILVVDDIMDESSEPPDMDKIRRFYSENLRRYFRGIVTIPLPIHEDDLTATFDSFNWK